MQIPADAPCSPQEGDIVTFKRGGQPMVATEIWEPLGTPADVAGGVPGTLAVATPTPTPTPAPVGQTETVIETTIDLTTDVTTVDGEQVVQASSADGSISATIPVAAVPDTATIDVTIDTIATPDIQVELPSGGSLATGEMMDISIIDDNGQPIIGFEDFVAFTVVVDPQATDLEAIAVGVWGPARWVLIPPSITPDGTVRFQTDHLTLFAILTLPKVTHQLTAGLNSITFTGADGTLAADVASEVGGLLESLLLFDAPSQSWLTFLPGAPAAVSTSAVAKPARRARAARAGARGGGVDRNRHHPGPERRSDGDAHPGPQPDRPPGRGRD